MKTTSVRPSVATATSNGRATTMPTAPTPGPPVDPEVLERPVRRRFTAEYKLGVLREVEGCGEPGQVGALLRREGLYSSHLTEWRRQRERGALAGLAPKKRGRVSPARHPLATRVAELERENTQLQRRLEQAETIIDVQKKLSALLGIPLSPSVSAASA